MDFTLVCDEFFKKHGVLGIAGNLEHFIKRYGMDEVEKESLIGDIEHLLETVKNATPVLFID